MPSMTIDQALQLGMQYQGAGRLAEAEHVYRQVVSASPGESRAHRALGRVLLALGRYAEAEPCFRAVLTLDGKAHGGYADLGLSLMAQGKDDEAIACYRQALLEDPRNAVALTNLGSLYRAKGNHEEAIAHFVRALDVQPRQLEAMINLGATLEAQGHFSRALEVYDRALAIDSAHPLLAFNIGVALAALGRAAEAVTWYQKAVALKPEYVQAWNNLGNALVSAGRGDEAIGAFRRAIALAPALVEASMNLGSLLTARAEHEEALAAYRQGLQHAPDAARLHSNLCFLMLLLPEADALAIRGEHERWNRRHAAPLARQAIAPENDRNPERRLRIGLVSPDFRDHVVGRNLLPLFREHDRAAAEWTCYSAAGTSDALTEIFRGTVERWRDIQAMDDAAVAAQIRADGIDILMDLALHTRDSRLPVFAHKPAPVQATFAGYPGTTGLDAIDYRISDPYLDPPGCDESVYSEKTIRLPETFWCYDPLGDDVPVSELPARGAGRVTFGCLNNFGKTNEPTWSLWARVLRAVDGSRLMLLSPAGSHRDRTAQFFGKEGVSADRIIFCPPLPRREYLRLYHQIDVGLDTLPYNGHTTSLDSLWMGVPVVTQVGRTVVGRAGYSQLMNLGMPELIARDEGEFVQIATGLARDLPRMEAMRRTLRGRMEQSPLMDAPRFARGIEAALREMWRAWCKTR